MLLKDHHEGYISWLDYERNQGRIQSNQQMHRNGQQDTQGPSREGWALLQGLVRCGRCGRGMYVSYGGARNSPKTTRTLQYRCSALRLKRGDPDCQVVGGKQINDVVVSAFLSVSAEASEQAACIALEELEAEEAAADMLWRHQIEQAEYEAARAERQYNTVEPENRLVSRT